MAVQQDRGSSQRLCGIPAADPALLALLLTTTFVVRQVGNFCLYPKRAGPASPITTGHEHLFHAPLWKRRNELYLFLR